MSLLFKLAVVNMLVLNLLWLTDLSHPRAIIYIAVNSLLSLVYVIFRPAQQRTFDER